MTLGSIDRCPVVPVHVITASNTEPLKFQMAGISPGSVGRVYHSLGSDICSAVSWQHQRRNCWSLHHLRTTGNPRTGIQVEINDV